MKIGIDLRQMVLGAGGGISQLVKGVCEHMLANHPEHQFLVFCTPFNRSLIEYEASNVRYFSLPTSTFFQDVDRLADKEKLPVLFRTYPIEDSLLFPLRKQIFLIPDNQHEIFPEFFSSDILKIRRAAFRRALSDAGAIGTISEFSRNALLEFPETRCTDLFLMPPSLQVVHERGVGDSGLSDSERALIPKTDYFLFPANLWKHKNHRRVLQAFRLFRETCRKSDMSLILTGHPKGWSELSQEFLRLPVTHLGFVRPELLRVLYERARALVFFSLYEGFGMPLLEAFDAGTPVVCSNTTSLPEVGGNAILTCDPTDVTAMAALMKCIHEDDELRAKLVNHGKARLHVYSWENSANSLIAACERLAGETKKSSQSIVDNTDKNLPLVSIVTPSYNQGRFIKKTIESVLTQSYPNIEYIVIDGGSNDGTVEILQAYGDRLDWVSESDRGQTHAINKGMAKVNGEILAYLNSDDIILSDAIQQIVQFFLKNPRCDMVYGNADYIDEEDKVTGSYKTDDYSLMRILKDCMVCQPAAFWRRRIADEIGPFDEKLDYAMDYDYWLRIAKAGGNICYLPKKLACSRIYPETKTRSARTQIYNEIFCVCKNHFGHVHLDYYQGYWHHFIYEKNNIASRILRRFPGSYLSLGWFHQKWDRRDQYTIRYAVGYLKRIMVHRLEEIKLFKKLLNRNIRQYSDEELQRLMKSRSVIGFESDNWLKPFVAIASSKRASGQILHLAGVAPVDLTMRVKAGNDEIYTCKFEKHQYKKIQFSSDTVGNRPLFIQFSDWVEDAANRHLSFLLQDTNIFLESDTI